MWSMQSETIDSYHPFPDFLLFWKSSGTSVTPRNILFYGWLWLCSVLFSSYIYFFYLFTITSVSWYWLQPPCNPVRDKRLRKMNEKENVKYQIQPDYAYSTHYWEGNYVICIYAPSGVANNYIRGPFPPLAPPWGRHCLLCHLVCLKVERKWWKVIL